MKLAYDFALVALMTTPPAVAQPWTTPATADSAPQVVAYEPGHVVELRSALGYQLLVELASDEQVKNIALGDSSAWQVNVDKDGNRIFLKPLRADERTNMTVVTSVRTYTFSLEALTEPAIGMPYTIAFNYPPPEAKPDHTQYVDVSAATRRLTKYRISGDRDIRPESVSNDGRRTYLSWPASAPIPAIYAVDGSGKERLVNGAMGTDDVYVVDGTPQVLVFRIDHSTARAERMFLRSGH
jgi:type IV secretion system protein VirB9